VRPGARLRGANVDVVAITASEPLVTGEHAYGLSSTVFADSGLLRECRHWCCWALALGLTARPRMSPLNQRARVRLALRFASSTSGPNPNQNPVSGDVVRSRNAPKTGVQTFTVQG